MTLCDIYTKAINARPSCVVKVYDTREDLLRNKPAAVYRDLNDIPFPTLTKEVAYFMVTEKGNILVTFGGWK